MKLHTHFYPARISVWILSFLLLLSSRDLEAQWTKTSGPPGISVNALYPFGSILFAGTSAKGVFKSNDNGSTWSIANAGIENRTVFSFISSGSTLYAGTDNGVYRSSNNGISWTVANSGIENQLVISLVTANGYVFAGTNSFGLFKSSDNGDTWTDANGGALESSSIDAICFASPNLIADADNLIYYSGDNGNSWTIAKNSPFIFSNQTSFLVQHDSILISSTSGVIQSFDGGLSWQAFIPVSPTAIISGLARSGKTIYAGSPSGLFASNSFGNKWKPVPASGLKLNNRINHAFCISGSRFLLAFDEVGIAASADKGRTWAYSVDGFTPASTIDNALVSSENLLLSGTHSDGIYQSLDAGTSWSKLGNTAPGDSLSNGIVFAVLKVNNILLAGTCGYGLYRSTDNGSTWTRIRKGLTQENGTYLCVNALAQSARNILVSTDQGLFYSSDTGKSWKLSNIPRLFNEPIGVAANDSVACAAVANFNTGSKIYRSIDQGVTWTNIPAPGGEYSCVASDGMNHFYVGSFSGSFVSDDDGLTFKSIGSGIPFGVGAFAIGVLGNNVFIGNNYGVFFSNNNGKSFRNVSSGFDPSPNHSVQGFAFSSTSIYAGTFQDAVWKRPLSDFGISLMQPKEFSAGIFEMNVYPNPFADQTTVNYSLPESENVSFTLYDIHGKIVYQSDEFESAGSHVKQISGNFSPGIYVLKAKTGTFTSTRKLIVQ